MLILKKIIHVLSRIQIELGILYFYLLYLFPSPICNAVEGFEAME